jgi:hypothetical protein
LGTAAASLQGYIRVDMEASRKQKDEKTGITYWKLSGWDFWPDNFPVNGRKELPLFFASICNL